MRVDVNSTPFNKDTKVELVGDYIPNLSQFLIETCIKSGMYATIHGDEAYDAKGFVGNDRTFISFQHFTSVAPTMAGYSSVFAYPTKNLRVIPENEIETYEKIRTNAIAKINECLEQIRAYKDKNDPAKVSFLERKFNWNDKNFFTTNFTNAVLGTWDKNAKTFSIHNCQIRAQCCAFTKCARDMEIYIPDAWLRYYEYTIFDLVEYMKFLTKCEIGFDYEYLGEVDLPSNFAYKEGNHISIQAFAVERTSTLTQTGNKGWHGIRLKGSVSPHITYLRFICLRYIYNEFYWSIPGHAMQIKKALGGLVTHWQALLLAHLHKPYYYYYNIGYQKDFDPAMPRKQTGNGLYDADNLNRHLDPFQSSQTLLNNLEKAQNVNPSAKYAIDKFERSRLDELFEAQDWMGLYKYALTSKVEEEKAVEVKV